MQARVSEGGLTHLLSLLQLRLKFSYLLHTRVLGVCFEQPQHCCLHSLLYFHTLELLPNKPVQCVCVCVCVCVWQFETFTK